MLEVEVRNFQSIEKAAFKIDGFTVIVGRSNIGKSALVRAVKAALTGAPVSSFVRHSSGCLRKAKGAKTCKCFASVHIQSEGFDLLWEKGDSVNRYTFNGQVYDKAERGTPDFLYPDFAPIKVGDRQDILQVADQFVPVFLLDQTGGTVADTLSDVAKLDRINVAMRLVEKDRKEATQTRKVREKDVVQLQSKLDDFKGLDQTLRDVQALDVLQVSVDKQERKVVEIESFMEKGSALAQTLRLLEQFSTVSVPSFQPVQKQARVYQEIGTYTQQVSDKTAALEALSDVGSLPHLEVQPLRSAYDTYVQLNQWLMCAVSCKDWILPWKGMDAIDLPMYTLKEAYQTLLLLDAHWNRYDALVSSLVRLEAELQEVDQLAREVQDEIDSLGVCPTCIRPLAECTG